MVLGNQVLWILLEIGMDQKCLSAPATLWYSVCHPQSGRQRQGCTHIPSICLWFLCAARSAPKCSGYNYWFCGGEIYTKASTILWGLSDQTSCEVLSFGLELHTQQNFVTANPAASFGQIPKKEVVTFSVLSREKWFQVCWQGWSKGKAELVTTHSPTEDLWENVPGNSTKAETILPQKLSANLLSRNCSGSCIIALLENGIIWVSKISYRSVHSKSLSFYSYLWSSSSLLSMDYLHFESWFGLEEKLETIKAKHPETSFPKCLEIALYIKGRTSPVHTFPLNNLAFSADSI